MEKSRIQKTQRALALASLLVFLAIGYCSCTRIYEKSKVRTYKIQDVSRLHIKGSLDVILVPGKTTRMWVEGPADKVDNFDVKQNKSSLWLKDNLSSPTHYNIIFLGHRNELKVYLSVPHLNYIDGEGNIIVGTDTDKPLALKKLYTRMHGNVVLEFGLLRSDSVRLDVDGNSVIKMKYIKCHYTGLKIAGNSVVKADYNDCLSGRLDADDNNIITLSGTMRQKMDVHTRGNIALNNGLKYVK